MSSSSARVIFAGIGALLSIGCESRRPRTEIPDSAAAARHTVSQAGEVLALREEAQEYLDSAQISFSQKNFSTASDQLREAASFLKAHADSSRNEGRIALLASVTELNRLADRLNGGPEPIRDFTNALTRVNLAEATFHRVRAIDDIADNNGGAAASELLMIVDHMERALHDLNTLPPSTTRQAMDSARDMASRLRLYQPVIPAEIDAVITALETETLRLEGLAGKIKSS